MPLLSDRRCSELWPTEDTRRGTAFPGRPISLGRPSYLTAPNGITHQFSVSRSLGWPHGRAGLRAFRLLRRSSTVARYFSGTLSSFSTSVILPASVTMIFEGSIVSSLLSPWITYWTPSCKALIVICPLLLLIAIDLPTFPGPSPRRPGLRP